MKCEQCGCEFEPVRVGHKFCSKRCRDNWWLLHRRRHEPKKNPLPSKRICAVCGKAFYSKHNNKKCCSAACSAENNRRRVEKKYVERQKAKWPEVPLKVCRQCGKEFKPHDAETIFCSRSCYETNRAQKSKVKKEPHISQLNDLAREARECNLDYGTYQAYRMMGKTYEELKAQGSSRQMRVHQHTPRRER